MFCHQLTLYFIFVTLGTILCASSENPCDSKIQFNLTLIGQIYQQTFYPRSVSKIDVFTVQLYDVKGHVETKNYSNYYLNLSNWQLLYYVNEVQPLELSIPYHIICQAPIPKRCKCDPQYYFKVSLCNPNTNVYQISIFNQSHEFLALSVDEMAFFPYYLN